MLLSGGRTENLYEEFPECPKPPLMPLPDLADLEALERGLIGTDKKGLSIKIFHKLLIAMGLKKFMDQLTDERLEDLLRRCDLRRHNHCALTISATVNLVDDPRELSPTQRAATFIVAAQQIYAEIISGNFPAEFYNGQALEMGQFPNLFGTSIILEKAGPRIFKSREASHVNLLIRRKFYSLELGPTGFPNKIECPDDILEELVWHAKRSPFSADEASLGLLSCAKISTQRKAFRHLNKDVSNRKTLDTLHQGLYTLCLDLDHYPETDAEAAHIAQSENLGNRWHHSSLQLVVFGNAKACAIFKFDACIDGNTMMRGAAEIQKRAACVELKSKAQESISCPPSITELQYRIKKSFIQKAYRDVSLILDNQRSTFEIQNIGRDFFKKLNIDPVPGFMLALHMAVVHLVGKPVRLEQHLTLSKYRCMGLTPAVVSTPEVAEFTQYASGFEVEKEKAKKMLLAAIDSQKSICSKVRSKLPYSQLITLFSFQMKGLEKFKVAAILIASKMLGIKWYSDVIVSHPSIYQEASMLGRPGVRLPYLNYFGLHYRIMDESIKVTMMPALSWDVPNAEFIQIFEEKLQKLKEIIRGD